MEIYLKCLEKRRLVDEEGHPEAILDKDIIYKANGITKEGNYYSDGSGIWHRKTFKEISKVEAFIYLRGRMDLVEELP